MMQCLMFSSFLIAELVRTQKIPGSHRFRGAAAVLFCSFYIAMMSAITYQHLYRDTVPLTLVENPEEIEKMFWHRNL
jgi:hypothetical protein